MIKIETLDGNIYEFNAETYNNLDLMGLNLHRAQLEHKILAKSLFQNTDLRGAFISYSDVSYSNFDNANMIVLNSFKTIYNFSSLKNVNLKSAWLEESSFLNCNFSNSNLERSDFSRTDLRNANFINCKGIETAIFKEAIYNQHTIWPSGYFPDENYLIYKD